MTDNTHPPNETLRRLDAMIDDMSGLRGTRMRQRRVALLWVWGVRATALMVLALGMWTLAEFVRHLNGFALFCAITNTLSAVSLIRTAERMATSLRKCDAHIERTVKELKELRSRAQQTVAQASHASREEAHMGPL